MPVELIDYGSHATETSHELLVLAFHKIGLAPTGSESTWFYIPDSVFDGYLTAFLTAIYPSLASMSLGMKYGSPSLFSKLEWDRPSLSFRSPMATTVQT